MLEPLHIGSADETAEKALLLETLAAIHTRARRYLQEPEEGAWLDFVDALARAHGDSATNEVLRAVEIHLLVDKRSYREP